MSYQSQRTSSTSAQTSHQPHTDMNPPSSQQSQGQGQSPLDWNNFINFQTPPVASRHGGYNESNGVPGSDQYKAFAQGIAMSNPHPEAISFQHPYTAPPRPNQPSPHQQLQLPSPMHNRSNSNNDGQMQQGMGKGKSPAKDQSQGQMNPDNGLTLDPAAFSRDIRFQVPTFLSNQSGATAYPPGGEAWSGFSGANFYGDGAAQLTPGTLFGQMFGTTPSDGQHNYNEQSGGGRNVLEGLSGFMGDNCENWSADQKDPSNQGTTYYVNPNPAQNVLAPPRQNGAARRPLVNTNPSPRKQNPSARQLAEQSPHSALPTSSLLPQQLTFPTGGVPGASYIPNATSSIDMQQTGSINIASSSTQPYAPPSNTQALLQGPNLGGPSLSDGPGLYSTTGFDMVGVLSRVAARKDPKTVLGPVDLSCSFLVVDIRRYDTPIVYASPTFSALTGYDLPQILRRNCRFLQSPDGDVVKGSKRKYTDNIAVAHLKRMLNAGKECQASLINYRRGGIPFINLVTVVPIPWDGTETVYHVGFQVDLVEQPNAILRNMRDGSYQVNYTVLNPPQPPLRPPGRDIGTSGLSEEVLEIMGPRVNAAGFGQGEEGGRMEWLKMASENADDFVHVLSLKGSFQYVSPSVRRVLEYEPEDLINKNISDICHPSDIVPLMRELKDSTHAPGEGQQARTVNLVFRIRRKSSGYIWIECSGRLHVEPGKGRKAVILSGRARSVPALSWDSVAKNGGLAEREFWARVSYQGLILHATSGIYDLLGQSPDDVVGQSLFSLIPGGDNGHPQSIDSSPAAVMAAAIRSAIHGETRNGATTIRHKMIQKFGGVIDVMTVFYTARQPSHDPDGNSDASPMSITSSLSLCGVRSVSLVVQVKMFQSSSGNPTSIAALTNARPIVHAASSNVFEELETTRGTSWQYELHQLRLLNRRLKEDIALAKVKARAGFGRKRKLEDGLGTMAPPPMPEHFMAAPRHQLAPGFGLLAPGQPSPYY